MATDKKPRIKRASVRPRARITAKALSPERPSPSTKRVNASAASWRHNVAKSSTAMPATAENTRKFWFPVATASVIDCSTLPTAVPPASASMPTEANAPAMASTCASARPAILPWPAILCAKCTILLSVVARLLPRWTTVAPSRSKFLWPLCITLAICARAMAASSLAILVAVPSMAMTSVNSAMFSA